MSNYQEAKKICIDSMWEFGCNINDYLADDSGEYLIDWSLEDTAYIKNELHSVISEILSTCMADHVSYELSTIRNEYDEAFKKQDISSCKMILAKLMEELAMIHAGCRAIKSA